LFQSFTDNRRKVGIVSSFHKKAITTVYFTQKNVRLYLSNCYVGQMSLCAWVICNNSRKWT